MYRARGPQNKTNTRTSTDDDEVDWETGLLRPVGCVLWTGNSVNARSGASGSAYVGNHRGARKRKERGGEGYATEGGVMPLQEAWRYIDLAAVALLRVTRPDAPAQT